MSLEWTNRRVEGFEYVFCTTGVEWGNVSVTSVRPLILSLTSNEQVIGTFVECEIDEECFKAMNGVLFQYKLVAPQAFGPVNSEFPIVLTNHNRFTPSFTVSFTEKEVAPIQDGECRHVGTVIGDRGTVLRFTARGPVGVCAKRD